MKVYFEEELRWFRIRVRLSRGYKATFCQKIKNRLSWDWIVANSNYKMYKKDIAEKAHLEVSDQELENFLINQKITIQ